MLMVKQSTLKHLPSFSLESNKLKFVSWNTWKDEPLWTNITNQFQLPYASTVPGPQQLARKCDGISCTLLCTRVLSVFSLAYPNAPVFSFCSLKCCCAKMSTITSSKLSTLLSQLKGKQSQPQQNIQQQSSAQPRRPTSSATGSQKNTRTQTQQQGEEDENQSNDVDILAATLLI